LSTRGDGQCGNRDHGQRQHQKTTVHGRYSLLGKNLVGYSRKIA
jgi:hypothetical protein